MQNIRFTSTVYCNTPNPYMRSKILSNTQNSQITFLHGTGDFIVQARGLINYGLRKFQTGFDSEASPEIELGAYHLYIAATSDEVENSSGKVITIENNLATLKLKEELLNESTRYSPITNVIYTKKLVIFSKLFSLEDLKKAQTDKDLLLKINKTLDELFAYQANFFARGLNDFGKKVVLGLKLHFLGDAYRINLNRLRIEIGGPKYGALLKELKIGATQDLLLKYDQVPLEERLRKISERINGRVGLFVTDSAPVSASTLEVIIKEIESGKINITTTAHSMFYKRFALNPLNPVNKVIQLREAVVPLVKQMTPFMEWQESKSKEPFLIIGLTDKDISSLIPKNKSEWKSIVSRYLQILNSGRLPHGDSSPKRGRLLFGNAECRQLAQLNKFLLESNVSPMHLFSSQNILLRSLYLAYKRMAKKENPANGSLEENLSRSQFVKIVTYLDSINSGTEDIDFKELALLDPVFREKVMSAKFLDALLDYVTKPAIPLVEATIVEPEVLSVEPLSDGVAQSYQFQTKKVEEDLSLSLPTIREITIPILDLLKPKKYKDYRETGILPNDKELVLWYESKIHLYNPHSAVHDEVHNYHHGNHTVRIIVQYSDGSTRDIRSYITDVRHALKELKEKGQSTYPLKDHHESS